MRAFSVRLAAAAAAAAVFATSLPAVAEWTPTQPIRVIIPYSAGGTSDLIARAMADPLRERLGQGLVLDNRGGGATQIGTSAVATAKPDGYTILLVANTFTINPSLFSKLPYDSLKDFAPITYAGVTPHTLVVTNDLPATDLKGLLDLARKRPGELNYGSVGNGTSFHLGMEELKQRSGTSMIHVPYKGMGQVLTDLISGNIQLAFANTPNAAPLVRDGKMRALAVAHPTRIHQLPEVPTVDEQGFPGFTSNSAFMFLAPGATPPEVLERLNKEFVAVLRLPAVHDLLTQQGIEITATTRTEAAEFIRREMDKNAELVRFSGAKVE